MSHNVYALRTDGKANGKPVRLLIFSGRWWLHIEVGSRAFGFRVKR